MSRTQVQGCSADGPPLTSSTRSTCQSETLDLCDPSGPTLERTRFIQELKRVSWQDERISRRVESAPPNSQKHSAVSPRLPRLPPSHGLRLRDAHESRTSEHVGGSKRGPEPSRTLQDLPGNQRYFQVGGASVNTKRRRVLSNRGQRSGDGFQQLGEGLLLLRFHLEPRSSWWSSSFMSTR